MSAATAAERLARVEESLSRIERGNDRSVDRLSREVRELHDKLLEHMEAEEGERHTWTTQLATLVERTQHLPEWKSALTLRMQALELWRAYLTGAVAIIGAIAVPLGLAWLRKLFGV